MTLSHHDLYPKSVNPLVFKARCRHRTHMMMYLVTGDIHLPRRRFHYSSRTFLVCLSVKGDSRDSLNEIFLFSNTGLLLIL